MIKYIPILLFIIPADLYGQKPISEENKKIKNTGFLDFNGYYDSREFSVMTLNILANLPNRFQYFSLTNFEGGTETSDLGSFFSEQNIRWKIGKSSPLDLVNQWVIRDGINNDNLRLGLRLSYHNLNFIKGIFSKVNMSYSTSFFIVEFGEEKKSKFFTQIEHVYRLNIFPKKLKNSVYLSGFADQNMIQEKEGKTSIKWVSEHQLGVMVLKNLYAVLEYRINDFLPAENYGIGYGIEYKISFTGQ